VRQITSCDDVTWPVKIAVSAITVAELAAGLYATTDPAERCAPPRPVATAEATFEPLPVDAAVALVYAAVALCAPSR
jgi:predicted nucleic acid-binding protein